MKLFECGYCGFYHKDGFFGDCRNDNERYTLEEIEFFQASSDIEVVPLEDQEIE